MQTQQDRQDQRTAATRGLVQAIRTAAGGRAARDELREEVGLPTSAEVREAALGLLGFERTKKTKSRSESPFLRDAPVTAGEAGAGGAGVLIGLGAGLLLLLSRP